MTRVRVPAWAVAEGLPAPDDDEEFVAYWTRVGIDPKAIDWALLGLDDERRRDVANERMGGYLIRTMPDAFARQVDLVRSRATRRPTAPL